MADHRAEQIMVALVTALTGLVTTTTHVFRGRVYPLAEAELPGLLIYSVNDSSDSGSFNFVDPTLSVVIEGRAEELSTQIETTLNKIRKEVVVALRATPNLGLGFVFDTVEGTTTFELFDGDVPGGLVRMEWSVQYRRSRNDPSQ